ncbi:MAG: replication-associated recombination protein A [Kiritimatiellia bacterium]
MSGTGDLFVAASAEDAARHAPLAARMRPQTLDEIAGQDHILGAGCLLRRAIQADRLGSMIFYGPPGCGKTSLAEVIAATTCRAFVRASGVVANVATVRDLMQAARHRQAERGRGTILFVDEIHRFNKSQQDVLLPYVEEGAVTLIGATTHNPIFFVNTPLTSRSLVFALHCLDEDAVIALMRRALSDSERGLGLFPTAAADEALAHIARCCEGDARRALNALELAVLTTSPAADGLIHLTIDVAVESVQQKTILYDRDEDGHYDTISALIKSMRGSDPDAAVYWLAKMLYAGEDPRFIARRLVIFASEDVGNADPRGLLMASAAMHAAETVGMPEVRINLAHVVTYLATAPKSNASYRAIGAAWGDIENGRSLPVPEHLKNVHVKPAEGGPVSEAYRYPHDYQGHYVEQEYVPTTAVYYEMTDQGYEATLAKRMALLRGKGKRYD